MKKIITLVITLLVLNNTYAIFEKQDSLSPYFYTSICFINNTGYIVGGECANNIILKSENAGESWEIMPVMDGSILCAVSFLDEQTGYTIDFNGNIFMTVDGAENWELQFSNTDPLLDMCFTNYSNGYAVGRNGILLQTTNGGETWTNKNLNCTSTLNKVYFIDSNIGFIIGGGDPDTKGVVYKTTDGGINWTEIHSNDTLFFRGIHFIDSNTGFIVDTYGSILKTTDGGLHWTENNTEYMLNDIFFINSEIGFATAEAGFILSTTNGGTTWEEIIDTEVINLGEICTINNNLFIVGSEGSILKQNINELTSLQNNISTDKSYNIYPTEVNNSLTIEVKNIVIGSLINIYDLQGNLLEKRDISNNTTIIDCSKLISGMYIVEIVDDTNKYSEVFRKK